MKRLPPPGFVLAHAAAARSPLTDPLPGGRPWLRLVLFLLLAPVLLTAFALATGALAAVFPSLGALLTDIGPLPDGPLRLQDEGVQAIVVGLLLGVLALAILCAAALAYRLPMTEFLWPGRRFDAGRFAIGMILMAAVSVILIPLQLSMGSEWAPPILDPRYLDHTRLTYVLAMTAGLLLAAAAEEVVFRGVLLRLTALVTRRPLLLCLINGLLFSAIHIDPDPVAFVARALAGMVWTWAALRLGGIEFAIGAHLANNLAISLFWGLFSEADLARDSRWIDLGPEILAGLVTLVFVERMASRHGGPSRGLPARSPA